ncbi:MAG: glycoside hydrolase family 32 protein [Bacteroidota bacterium]|nr:glycoside hydrolase family 32 protein [Bacteroidota bacterium]
MKNSFPRFGAVLIFIIICSYAVCQQQGPNKEQYRPSYHFTPAAHWMNDPNGLVYYEGEYHLFYQYYPEASVWGPMHWGHAVSKDLLHWKHLPIALYPDSLGYIFSGSAVIDHDNTSGLGTKQNPPMIAIFAYHNPKLEKSGSNQYQYQGLAYSLDKGRTWTKYAKNPVVPNPGIRDFRDPKVIWDAETQKWILVLAAGDQIQFYSSPNLINWNLETSFGKSLGAHGGVWECPDLFPLEVKGTHDKKWVLLVSLNPGGPNGGSASQYFVGDFDGHQFKPDNTPTRWVDYGKDNYAGVTWSDIPASDGRRIFLGWMSNWQYAERVPTETWRSATTIPRELNLIRENNEYLLTSQPVKELAKLRIDSVKMRLTKVNGAYDISKQKTFGKSPLEIIITFNTKNRNSAGFAKKFGIKLSNEIKEEVLIGYDLKQKQFFVNRKKSGKVSFSDAFPGIFTAPWELKGNTLEMHLFVDEASVELFGQQGRVLLTEIFFPAKPYSQLSVFTEDGKIEVKECEVWKLNSIW